jgi:hypothetical protein
MILFHTTTRDEPICVPDTLTYVDVHMPVKLSIQLTLSL